MKQAGFAVVAVLLVAFVVFAFYSFMTTGANPVVVMETSMGTVKIELFQDRAPISVANRAAMLMDAAAALDVPNEQVSAWVVELQRLAADVLSLPPAARHAIRTALDVVAFDDPHEQEQARQLRNQIDTLDRVSVTAQPDSGAAAVSEPLTAPPRPQRRREPWRVLVASARWS